MKALERDSGLGGITLYTLPHKSRSTIYIKYYGTIGKSQADREPPSNK